MKLRKKSDKTTHPIERKKRFHAWIDSLPEFDPNPTKIKFWRDSFIVFLSAGLLGHVMDLLWRVMNNVPIDTWAWQLLPLIAEPYGLAALGLLWFVYPLVRYKKISPFFTYIIGAAVTTIIELMCGLVLMASHHGYNPYWDYSHLPFNLFGQVCLYNSVMFGFASVAFVYFLFPWLDIKVKQIPKWVTNGIVIALAAWYATSLMFQLLTGFRIII